MLRVPAGFVSLLMLSILALLVIGMSLVTKAHRDVRRKIHLLPWSNFQVHIATMHSECSSLEKC